MAMYPGLGGPWLARPQGSLRQWLLGASVAAVLAGYTVLLLAYSWLADQDRRALHHEIGARLETLLDSGGALTPSQTSSGVMAWRLAGGQSRVLLPGLSPASPGPPLELVQRRTGRDGVAGPWRYQGRTYLSSAMPLVRDGTVNRLLLLQDVSFDVQRQQRNSLLLVAFAGISTLVSAALLRPVLNAGLRPLQDLSARMEQIETESLARQRLPLAPQPRELQAIAATFNDLLDRLAVSWERQRAFVNAVSHELRTPITLVAGYAARLQRRGTNLSADDRQQLQLIQEEAGRMASMVTDLLDIARSDAGQLILRQDPFPVADACLRVVTRLRPVAGERLRLQAAGAGSSSGLEAKGDAERFEQCLLNLVENALKYSPASGLVQLTWERAEVGGVVVHVLDQGPGVPAHERARLLERFQRGSGTGDIPGSGIGLAVVDTLMQAMGGRVEIADAPGGGADFQLLLPEAGQSEARPVPIRRPAPSS